MLKVAIYGEGLLESPRFTSNIDSICHYGEARNSDRM